MGVDIDRGKPVFTIRVAASVTGLHPQTIRVYESRGLVSPARTGGGTRMYSQLDIDRILEIARLSSEGVGIPGIARILALEEENARLSRENARLRCQLASQEPTAIVLRATMPALAPRRQGPSPAPDA